MTKRPVNKCLQVFFDVYRTIDVLCPCIISDGIRCVHVATPTCTVVNLSGGVNRFDVRYALNHYYYTN